jgi:hypothetical protein
MRKYTVERQTQAAIHLPGGTSTEGAHVVQVCVQLNQHLPVSRPYALLTLSAEPQSRSRRCTWLQ